MFRFFTRSKANARPEPDDKADKEHLMVEVGKALILCQVVEKQLALCAHVIFRDPNLSVADWLREKERITMLQPVINKLKTRAILTSEFETLLNDFREHRNTLVHDFIRLPDFDIKTEAGREFGMSWAVKLTAEAYSILGAIAPIAKEHRIKLGLEPSEWVK